MMLVNLLCMRQNAPEDV